MINEITNIDAVRPYVTFDNKPFFELAAKHCEQGMSVLDVGAGRGGFADLLGNPDIYLIDGNPTTTAHLQKKYNNVYLHTLPERIPFDDGFFDIIHCSHIIEHLDPNALYASLQEFDRCLKQGGKLIISTPLLYPDFYDDLSHFKPYTPMVLRHYLADPGLDNRTRQTISTAYTVEELQYRYNLEPVPYFNVTYSRRWVQNFFIKFVNLLRRLSMSYYQRTAYTLVLKKGDPD